MNDRATDSETFLTLQEIVAAARRALAPGPWNYMIGGAETETTVRRNRLALDSIAFRPRVLRDVRRVDASSAFLGRPVRLARAARAGGRHGIVGRRRRGHGRPRGRGLRRAADALLGVRSGA